MMMNRRHFWGFVLLTAAMLLSGCSAEILDGHSGQVPIYLTASVQEGGAQGVTRAGTDVQSTQLPNGEEFYGYFPSGATVSSATFTADGSGGTTANPQPYFTLTDNETTVHAYHGKSGGTNQVTNETTSFSVATDQSYDAAYQASDLMYATATVQKSNPVGALTFTHRMAKIIVNATLGDGISSISAVKIIGGLPTVALSGTDCTVGAASGTAFSTSNPLTVHSGNSTAATLNCAALIPPQTVNANFLQIVTDKGTVTYSLSNKVFATAQSYTFNITINAAAIGTTIAITDWGNNGSATVNPTVVNEVYRQAVDLGLSVKWANMNVGASSPTDYGMYFMWGEVAGHPGANDGDGSNDHATDGFSFSWANYKWNPSGDGSTFTKYTGSDYTTLETADDAARANWGGKWRMPTMEEFNELLNNTTKAWTSDYNDTGVAGYTFTANGQTLFLPAAGDRYNATVERQGSYGYYWSSALYTGNPLGAWYLRFNSGNAGMNGSGRSHGYAVRAVQSN